MSSQATSRWLFLVSTVFPAIFNHKYYFNYIGRFHVIKIVNLRHITCPIWYHHVTSQIRTSTYLWNPKCSFLLITSRRIASEVSSFKSSVCHSFWLKHEHISSVRVGRVSLSIKCTFNASRIKIYTESVLKPINYRLCVVSRNWT